MKSRVASVSWGLLGAVFNSRQLVVMVRFACDAVKGLTNALYCSNMLCKWNLTIKRWHYRITNYAVLRTDEYIVVQMTCMTLTIILHDGILISRIIAFGPKLPLLFTPILQYFAFLDSQISATQAVRTDHYTWLLYYVTTRRVDTII